jgi:UDP-3-O-[3-hydroxymyristoyl] glucosamine N-acyltransferase
MSNSRAGDYRQGYIAPSSRIAPDAIIYPMVYIGEEVIIGSGTIIYPFSTILDQTEIGNRVVIGPGCAIGGSGFGYEKTAAGYRRFSHAGRVVIEDEVEIGANVTVDRAKRGETRIGRGSKIDSLVHIGHNVKIGSDCIIIAQVGIGGSAVIGDGVTLAGQVGVKDHARVGSGSVVYAKSALLKSIPANTQYSGIPARPHYKTLRAWARLFRD